MNDSPKTASILIQQAHVVFPDAVRIADLRIRAGKIEAIDSNLIPEATDTLIPAQGKYLLPGFIDIHNHGARGFDASFGRYLPDTNTFDGSASAYEEGLTEALGFYAKQGVTRVLPTSLAAPVETLLQSFFQLASYATTEGNALRHLIAGINLEGTFIKDPAFAGAQNSDYFYPLDTALFDQLNDASGGRIRIVNLPPEHGTVGCDFTRYLTKKGVVVAGGHSSATADQFDAAIAAGLRLGVHFLNGPSWSSSKPFHGGGAIQSMLRSDEMSLELIVDGYHVAPAYVRDVIARKGAERVIMITDSVFVNECPEIEQFSLSGIPGEVSENGQYLQVRNKANSLFGSVLNMDRGFANMLNWLTREMTGVWTRKHEALSLEAALISASKMASGQPAQLLNLYAEDNGSGAGTGSIEMGKWGDLVLATIAETAEGYAFTPETTFLRGVKIVDSD